MTSTIYSSNRVFPVGEVIQLEGEQLHITHRLRGGTTAGQYEGALVGGRTGAAAVVTIAPALTGDLAAVERELAIPAYQIARLYGIVPLVAPDGTRVHALIEGKPNGAPLAQASLPLALADVLRIGIDLGQILEGVGRAGSAVGGIRPELVYLKQEDAQLVVSAMVPRGETFMARGQSGAAGLFSARYRAPELDGADAGTPAGDVFSLCATLAFAASGQHPFEGVDAAEQLAAMRAGRRTPWTGPVELDAVLARGLAADPAQRPPVGELIVALREYGDSTGSAPGLRERILAVFRRKESTAPPGRPAAAVAGSFPIGAHLAGQDFTVTERLTGERWRGRYRGVDRAGGRVLVTIAGEQTEKASRLRRQLEMDSPGIVRLRYVGQVVGESGGAPFDGLVEDEPPGQPAAQASAGLTPRTGLELGMSLAHIVAQAHAAGLVIGCLQPELIYVTTDAGRIACSGVAPRADRFLRTAARPNFGLPDLFASEYRAPEELADGSRSMAGDVFAVSALSIEWVSGQFPFEGEMYIQRALAVQMYQRRTLSLSPLVQQFLERGLDRDPARRPSMQDWLAAADAVKAAL